MDLMLDPACELETWADALKVGKACDAANFFWLEDPYQDGGVSIFGHRKLRELINTPLLQTEHVFGLEQHVDFIVNDGTDFVRTGTYEDGGITGAMKVAHASEGFGLDVEFHGRRLGTSALHRCRSQHQLLRTGAVAPTDSPDEAANPSARIYG